MTINDLPSNLLERLVEDKMRKHPLPWSLTPDWTVEVYDVNKKLVIKCLHMAEATELVQLANRLKREEDEAKAEIEIMLAEP